MRAHLKALSFLIALGAAGCGDRGHLGVDSDGGRRDGARSDGATSDGATPDGSPHDGAVAPDGGVRFDGAVPLDGGVLPDGAVPHDGGVLLDAGPHDGTVHLDGPIGPDAGLCAVPAVWHLMTRPILSLSHVSDAPARMGVTEQLRIEVQLYSGSCEVLGPVDVQLSPGGATDFVTVRASVWRLTGEIGCTADAPVVTTVALVPGREQGNLHVVVTDGNSSTGGVVLTYDRQPCSGVPACQCSPTQPPGPTAEYGDCVTDCSCATGLSCLGYSSFVGATYSCLQPCADDRDCAAGRRCAQFVADGPAYVCTPGDQCGGGGDCPAGFACVADTATGRRSCQDQRPYGWYQACSCDQDCASGSRCVLDEDVVACAITCVKDSDCPEPRYDGICAGVCRSVWF